MVHLSGFSAAVCKLDIKTELVLSNCNKMSTLTLNFMANVTHYINSIPQHHNTFYNPLLLYVHAGFVNKHSDTSSI